MGAAGLRRMCVWGGAGYRLPTLFQLSSFPPLPSSVMPLKIPNPREESDWLSWGHVHAHWAWDGRAP